MARETWVQSQVESYQRLKKMVLDAPLLNTQNYKVWIKGKVELSRKGVAPCPTPLCSSYRKGNLRVNLDYGRQFYLLITKKSWRQHPTRHQLYGHLPPIMKTIQVRRTRHTGHCWRSKDKLVSDVLLWTPTYGQAKAGRLARTYIQQLCEDTGCNFEDLPEAMNDREKWREMVRDIRAGSTT